jgi:transposase
MLDIHPTFRVFFMVRHDERFKQAVVQAYLSGVGGYDTVSATHDVSPSLVQQWVGHYRQHGEAGLRKKFSHYSADFKLSVLQQMRQQELSFTQTAVLFDLRGGSAVVSGWQRRYHEGGLEALKSKPRGSPPKMKPPKPPKTPKTPISLRTPKKLGAHEPSSEQPLEQAQEQEASTLESLRRENEYLRAEVAYLKKLDALVRAQKRPVPTKRKP